MAEAESKSLKELNIEAHGRSGEESTDCNCDTSKEDTGVDGPTTKPTYIVPPIGTKGIFTFESPFDDKMYNNAEYEVKAIRSLSEMHDSEEKPYENIYQPVNLTEKDFKTDMDHNVPIIVLASSGGSYYYVPASKLKSMPKITGIKYQQVMLAINLGYLPISFNLDVAKDTIVNDIKSTLGITSTVEAIKTSAVQLVNEDDHTTFQKLLDTNKKIRNSYRVRYELLSKKYEELRKKLKILNNCMINHIKAGKPIQQEDY